MAAKKRSEPGSDKEKDPNGDINLSPADVEKLKDLQKDFARVELLLDRRAIKDLQPLYEKRRAVLKTIPKFWPQALFNCQQFGLHALLDEDRDALSYLEDLWIERDAVEPRVFTVEFHFKENPYFSDAVVKKVYKYVPEAGSDASPDADGLTKAAFDFDWDEHVKPQATQIAWKDDAHNLVKKHPWVQSEEDEELPEDAGSVFNYFVREADPFGLAEVLGMEVFPDAVAYFNGEDDDDDITDSDEEADDDGAEEIDLDQPKKKKVKA
ncbi:hypothetical protein EXIGLDRAFT_830555 [Exidia glandulosa HHB12029]|uniref:NAP-domain-containing protein n=1 Tax=Exidia glandulosa HHB12029 TaxID=1314781 RepID=A0A165NF90_EXIGL|nr:hypothetical protein EXIGLDRAFT_830555 [Exidia glandulosa HHB12029]